MFDIQMLQGEWTLAGVLTLITALVLTAIASRLPLRLSRYRGLSLTAAPLILAALVLAPWQAPIAALGVGLAWRGGDAQAGAFKVVRFGLATLVASLLFHGFAAEGTALLSGLGLSAALLAVAAFAAVSVALMGNGDESPKVQSDVAAHMGAAVLGYGIAAVAGEVWWAGFLLVGPLVLAHVVSSRLLDSIQMSNRRIGALATQIQAYESAGISASTIAQVEAIKTLATGIAHEVNNPLFAMAGRMELLLRKADMYLKSGVAREELEAMLVEVKEAQHVVQAIQESAGFNDIRTEVAREFHERQAVTAYNR